MIKYMRAMMINICNSPANSFLIFSRYINVEIDITFDRSILKDLQFKEFVQIK